MIAIKECRTLRLESLKYGINPIVQHLITLRRHDGFGVALNAEVREVVMLNGHDDAFLAP